MDKSLIDQLWVVSASTLVFVMQAGFAMVESGMTRSKNSINVAVKNLTDFGVSTLVFWGFGFALMFGLTLGGIVGTSGFAFDSGDSWPWVFFLFQTMFCSTAATIVSGAVAERMRFSSYILTTVVLSGLIYPVFGHWAWGGAGEGQPTGWLVKLGFVDFAGSTVVHSVGGWASLALLLILGPRTGRFRADGTVATINGSNIPMAVLGVCLLWFGWFGFNGGSTLAMNGDVAGIIVRTTLGGAAGMIGALALGWPIYRKPDINLVINGSLVGLVAITANCHAVSAASALVIGAVGGMLMVGTTFVLERLRIDDAVGAIPVHLVGGVWGTLAVALFGDPARLATGLGFGPQLAVQALGIAVCAVWTFGVAFGTSWLINLVRPIRVAALDEAQGLNKTEHGVTTEINDLYQALDEQARTGDISLRAPVEPFTEAGQIASMYNTVLERLEENTVAKGEYIQIMRNVGDGMFLLDSGGRIGPYYSAALEHLFGNAELSGRELNAVLASQIEAGDQANLAEYLALAFDPQVAWRHVEKLNPLADVSVHQDTGSGTFTERRLQFHFRRIEDGGRIGRLLVLVRDMTAEKLLNAELERTREQGQHEMELLYRVLHVEPGTLREFLDGMRGELLTINECFRAGEGDVHERLTEVFRLTHAIKGDAELLELSFLGEKAEALEEQVRKILAQKEPDGEDFLTMTLLFSDLNTASEELHALVDKLQGFRNQLGHDGFDQVQELVGAAEAAQVRAEFMKNSLSGMAERLAARYGKSVRVEAETGSLAGLDEERRRSLREILVQLIRNAVFHGIEPPDLREAAGKPAHGLITISVKPTASGLQVEFRDDGAGLNLDLIRQRAVSRGLVAAERGAGMAERELIPLIFHPGFSTATAADTVGGKGIGLSLVRKLVKGLGGRLAVRSTSGQGSLFRIDLPMPAAAEGAVLP